MKKHTTSLSVLVAIFSLVGGLFSARAETQLTGSLTNGLVAYYPLKGDANDYSGNGNNGIQTNIVYATNRFGTPNTAADFHNNGYIICPNLQLVNHYPITLSIWYLLKGYSPSGIRMTIMGQEASGIVGELAITEDTVNGSSNNIVCTTGGGDLQTPIIPNTNEWHSIIYTSDSNNNISLYHDGVLVYQGNYYTYGTLNSTLPFLIGCSSGTLQLRKSWNGLLSDCRIFNRALSSNEVATLYSIESIPFWTNGIGYSTNSNSVTILGYNSSNNSVAIPSTINGIPVTSIGDYAFAYQTGITAIMIPSSITNLGNSVFSGCSNLTSVTIPDSVVSLGTAIFSGSPNVAINGSQSLIGFLAQNADALGCTGNALTSIQNGGTASGCFGWIQNWLVDNDTFISRIAARILSGTNNYGIAVKQNQTLTFPAIAPITYTSNAMVKLSATSSGGLTPVTYSTANASVATIVSNNVLSIKGAGSTVVTASQVGNPLYNPVSATQTLTVNPIVQRMTFPAIPPKNFANTRTVTLNASSSANLPITYIIGNYAVATNATSNTITILGAGTTTVTATNVGTQNYTPAGAVQTLIVK